MSHWAALSVSLILVLHILQGKVILEFGEIVSKLLGCAMRIYVFPCGLGSYRDHKKLYE